MKHPNNNTQPAVISWEAQQIVEKHCWEAGQNFRNRYDREPSNREVYNIALFTIGNTIMPAIERSESEHCLWVIYTSLNH